MENIIALEQLTQTRDGADLDCEVTALARDENGQNWAKIVTYQDADGVQHDEIIPCTMLAGDGTEALRVLLAGGLQIPVGRNEQKSFLNGLMAAQPPERALLVRNTGWNGAAYVNADGKVYGETKEKIILQAKSASGGCTIKGSLAGWQDAVAKYAIGNSRLSFSISAALAGPLLALTGDDPGGFHFAGESSGGKTTALRVAASVWGQKINTWRTTDNAAESWCRTANDGLLLLDELSQVDGKAAEAMGYMLGNGQGKGRAGRDGNARAQATWRLIFLSTGEIGLSDKIAESGKGKKAKAGQTIRLLEIPADAGAGMRMFENLHNFESPDLLAVHLAKASEAECGAAADAFLSELVKLPADQLKAAILEGRKQWTDKFCPAEADGQVKRAAARFGLVAAAGALGQRLAILPWPDDEPFTAAGRCFNDWIAQRGGGASHEVNEGLQAILSFIELHGTARFQDAEAPMAVIRDRAGFKGRLSGEAFEYLVFPETFRKEILSGSRGEKSIIKAAIAAGLIQPGKDGRATVSRYIPGIGDQKRVFCITPESYRGGGNE